MTIAEAIQHYAAVLGPSMLRTTARTLEVPGVYRAKQLIYGTLDPTQHLDFTNRTTLSNSMVKRYGRGFGAPITQDLTVLPAISFVQDADHALWALGLEEGTYYPADKALALLGTTVLTTEDRSDLMACVDFNDAVIRCTDLGLPLGTPRSQWQVLQQQAQQQQVPQQTQQPVQQQQMSQQIQQTTTPVIQSAPIALDLQSLSSILNQVLPGLVAVEVARALPKGVDPSAVIPDITPLQSQLNTANQTLSVIREAIQGVKITPSGGGGPMIAIRKIAAALNK